MIEKPIVAITMGDPSGVGPEICLLALCHTETYAHIRPIVVGDAQRLRTALIALSEAGRFTTEAPRVLAVKSVSEARFEPGVIEVIDLANVPLDLPWGKVNQTAGRAGFAYVETAVELAVRGVVEAICTAPIHKEAWRLAAIQFPGHTEALAVLSNSPRHAMMLSNGKLRVVHVTTHVSLREAIEGVTHETVFERIMLTAESLRRFGIEQPKIAVAGLNPHAGEGGLFGSEEIHEIVPAVERARSLGFDVRGPIPPDSVFCRGAAGEFDAVIALYHDQGHIAIKMLGIDTGVNITIGLPILRTSVDHGTAFDIAGHGIVRGEGMIAALQATATLLRESKSCSNSLDEEIEVKR